MQSTPLDDEPLLNTAHT